MTPSFLGSSGGNDPPVDNCADATVLTNTTERAAMAPNKRFSEFTRGPPTAARIPHSVHPNTRLAAHHMWG